MGFVAVGSGLRIWYLSIYLFVCVLKSVCTHIPCHVGHVPTSTMASDVCTCRATSETTVMCVDVDKLPPNNLPCLFHPLSLTHTSSPSSLSLYLTLIAERYSVDQVSQDSREDCYLSTLHITDVDLHDSRPYYLVVDNERGIDRHAINLIVEGMFTGATY